MTQTFNIKRFGLCLKYRLFDPITLLAITVALWMGAYAVYKRRQVNNG